MDSSDVVSQREHAQVFITQQFFGNSCDEWYCGIVLITIKQRTIRWAFCDGLKVLRQNQGDTNN